MERNRREILVQTTIQVQTPLNLTDAQFINILEWLPQKSCMKLNQKLSKWRHKAAELLMSVPGSPEAKLLAQGVTGLGHGAASSYTSLLSDLNVP